MLSRPADVEAAGDRLGRAADPVDLLASERDRRQRARRVAGVDAGLLDVLHHAAEEELLAVEDGVDVDLDRVVEEPVDQHRLALVDQPVGDVLLEVGLQRGVVVDDLHAAPAQDVGRAHQDRVADLVGDPLRLGVRRRGAVLGRRQAGVGEDAAEGAALLGEVDRLGRGADDRHAGVGEALREAERGLAAELAHDAGDRAGLLLGVDDLEDVLQRQRLEVEPVGGVVVGADRLRVAVDHDRLVAGLGQRERGVHAAVVELDALADAVGPGAEDDHGLLALRAGPHLGLLVVGRVVVGRLGGELGGAGVDGLVDRPDAQGVPDAADDVGGQAADLADLLVGEAVALGEAQQVGGELGRPRSAATATSLISASWSTNHGSILVASKTSSGVAPARIASMTFLRRPSVRDLDLLEQRRLVELDVRPCASRTGACLLSSERSAFCSASVKLRPMAIASPTDFMCVVSVGSASGNFSKANRGTLTTT